MILLSSGFGIRASYWMLLKTFEFSCRVASVLQGPICQFARSECEKSPKLTGKFAGDRFCWVLRGLGLFDAFGWQICRPICDGDQSASRE
jgi:hypothetical protein